MPSVEGPGRHVERASQREKLEVMKDDMESKIFEAQEELKHAKQESAKVHNKPVSA